MSEFRKLLGEILNSINYDGDKEAYVESFLKNIHIEAMSNLVKTLPEDKQADLKQKLNSADDINKVLNEHFTSDQINDSYKNTTQKSLTDFVQALSPSLNNSQKDSIKKLFENFHS